MRFTYFKVSFMHNSNATKQLPSLLSVKLFAEKYPVFTKSILRSWLFYSTKNGFDRCIVLISLKELISKTAGSMRKMRREQAGSMSLPAN